MSRASARLDVYRTIRARSDREGSEAMLLECPHNHRAFNELGEVITIACDRWACEYCRKANSYRWAERVKYGIDLAQPYDAYMWTLTLPGWVHYASTGFRVLPDLWDKFRREVQTFYQVWDYAAFVECHPVRGFIPHFHIISLRAAPYRLKDVAKHCGFGYMARERQITSKGAAGYVTKYCSKQGFAMPKGFRRVRVSRGWPKLPTPLYDHTVYLPKARESIETYVRRMATITGEDYNILMSRWLS